MMIHYFQLGGCWLGEGRRLKSNRTRSWCSLEPRNESIANGGTGSFRSGDNVVSLGRVRSHEIACLGNVLLKNLFCISFWFICVYNYLSFVNESLRLPRAFWRHRLVLCRSDIERDSTVAVSYCYRVRCLTKSLLHNYLYWNTTKLRHLLVVGCFLTWV